MRKRSRVGGLFWLILGLGISIESFKLNLGNLRKPGPGFLPLLAGLVLGLLGAILIISNYPEESKEERMRANIWEKQNWRLFLFTLCALFGYVFLLKLLGFLLTTFIFLFLLYKLTEPKHWLLPLILSGGIVSLSYLIFCIWLQCQFPKGIFKF